MQIASSAKRVCRLWRSASEYTATVRMPRSLQAQMMRRAISPRLAIRIFWNIRLAGTDREQSLAVFYRASVFHQLGDDCATRLGFNFVHQLHRFDDAQNLAGLDGIADFDKRWSVGRGRIVIGSD